MREGKLGSSVGFERGGGRDLIGWLSDTLAGKRKRETEGRAVLLLRRFWCLDAW